MPEEALQIETTLRVGRSLWSDATRRLMRDPVAMICLGIILVYAVIAIAAPFFLSGWADSFNFENLNQPPSEKFIFGTDTFGRSVAGKTFLGAHLSLTVALWANLIAVPMGIVIGAVAGYYGGLIDDFIVWVYTTLSCIPGILLLIALKFALQGKMLLDFSFAGIEFAGIDMDGMAGLILVLSVTSWIGICRLVRAEAMRLREQDFVLAARATGRNSVGILFSHIIPNVLHLGIISFSLGFVGAIKAEVILSYLGLGVHNAPSWGKMIDAARMDLIVGRWWEITAAVAAIFFIVLAWSIFGDRLRDALDPKLKNI